ncbi:two-component system QseEF-associated lipoprotein QseG [Affinibrenneria salicis]|uniref:Two-component system QseEF-associated lipoprotein QseG n=1 Tax=Affinibrenneria salicis TaxID=2590031 RepID=A0A5J5FRB2_9GAMM|nr:two-component system QseEF-associated lipoprotein QseG [Affinibrenneria salicis]KAA8995711.1 two-component system QseEF-associated lipoprotein QseG [Affinibrenneria salicis]
MNAWSGQTLFRHASATLSARPLARVLKAIVMFSPLLLAGCSNSVISRELMSGAGNEIPAEEVADYRVAHCDTIWQHDEREAIDNGLYWLRAMDCGARLAPEQARAAAQQLNGDNWQTAFKQNILLDNATLSVAERRQLAERLSRFRADFPSGVRPLLQTWRERQGFILALADERGRYQRLQESSDKQLDTLREQQERLQSQLAETTRKLENLTDIERQLSSRKQLSGELPDSEAERRSSAAKSSSAAAQEPAAKKEPDPE